MRRATIGLLGLLGVAFAVAPASAVSVPGCGDFIIFAQTDIIFEQGNTLLTGDIFLQNPTGKIKIGANNIIHGTVSANKIIVGSGALVDECVANVVELQGTGKCTATTIGFNPAAACTASFPPAPITLPVFPAVCVPGTAINATTSQALAPGCYSSIRAGKNVTLTLTAGGTYFVKGGEMRQLAGSTVIGGNGKPDAAATINISGQYITENGVFLTNLFINSTNTGGQAVQIFNDSLLKDVLVSTLGNLHPHTGTQLRGNTELVAGTFHDIEPITNETPPVENFCRCDPNFHFLLETPTNLDDRRCVPNTQ